MVLTAETDSVQSFPPDMPNRVFHLGEALVRELSERGIPGRPLVACCIGTDRSTGDAFGPLVGQALARSWRRPGAVIGTIAEPLHALNMDERTTHLRRGAPLVIAVDAALGPLASVGTIHMVPAGVQPGQGVGKSIPVLGELSITATVNVQAGAMSSQVLQSTRLHLVQQLAETVSHAMLGAIRRLERGRALAGAL